MDPNGPEYYQRRRHPHIHLESWEQGGDLTEILRPILSMLKMSANTIWPSLPTVATLIMILSLYPMTSTSMCWPLTSRAA